MTDEEWFAAQKDTYKQNWFMGGYHAMDMDPSSPMTRICNGVAINDYAAWSHETPTITAWRLAGGDDDRYRALISIRSNIHGCEIKCPDCGEPVIPIVDLGKRGDFTLVAICPNEKTVVARACNPAGPLWPAGRITVERVYMTLMWLAAGSKTFT